jgi:hypothetical protein
MTRRTLSARRGRHHRGRWEALCLRTDCPRRVQVSLHTHALTDYLFYALYRTDRLGLGIPVELRAFPTVECFGHFPQYAALRGAQSAEELPALLEEYYAEELARHDLPLRELAPRIQAAVRGYAEYLPFWHARIFPLESQLLDAWREQARDGEVMELFQRATRLRWPFGEVRLHACYHHPSGSALTPYPYLFSTLFDRYAVEPSVAWFVGHEAIHLLLDAVVWWEHAAAPAAIRWMGGRYLAEEALCLVFQNRMATICGLLPEAEMQVLGGSAKHLRVYRWLQEHWDEYLTDPVRYPTVVEYLVAGVYGTRVDGRRERHHHGSRAATALAA